MSMNKIENAKKEELQRAIVLKEQEIVHYRKILSKYYGRWVDYGLRSIARLEEELAALKAQESSAPSDP